MKMLRRLCLCGRCVTTGFWPCSCWRALLLDFGMYVPHVFVALMINWSALGRAQQAICRARLELGVPDAKILVKYLRKY